MFFRVLGPLEVHGSDGEVHRLGRSKAATVLATLLQHPNAWVTSAELIAVTWPEAAAPVSAAANLKTYVWRLRRLLADGGASRIEAAAGRYRLRVEPGELDADVAAGYAARARAAAGAGESARAAEVLETALALWRGRPDDAFGDAFTDLHRRLREDLAGAQLALGRPTDAVRTLRSLTEDDPLREKAWANFVRALCAAGERAEALRAYDKAKEVLAAELGVGPGAELTAAYRDTLGERSVASRAARGYVLSELAELPGEFTLGELAARLGRSKGSLAADLDALVDVCLLEPLGREWYRVHPLLRHSTCPGCLAARLVRVVA